jgi:glycogen synthase
MANVGDVATMTKKAIALFKDEEQLKQIKQNAREQAAKFSIHHIVPLYEELYQRFVNASTTA